MVEKLHAHNDTALDSSHNYTRLQMWNNQQIMSTSCCQSEVICSWNPTSKILPTVALLAFEEPDVHRDWPYKDNDAEVRAATLTTVNCECGEPHTMLHFLCCRLLGEPCSHEDLITVYQISSTLRLSHRHFPSSQTSFATFRTLCVFLAASIRRHNNGRIVDFPGWNPYCLSLMFTISVNLFSVTHSNNINALLKTLILRSCYDPV